MKKEYKVRHGERFIVTEYIVDGDVASSTALCVAENWEHAIDLAKDLARARGGEYVIDVPRGLGEP